MWPDSDDGSAMFHGLPFGLGLKASLPDHRDWNFSTIAPTDIALPPKVSYREKFDWRWNQQNTNSCTAFSTLAAVKYTLRKDTNLDFDPSQLFTYWCTRVMENDPNRDEGAEIRDTFKTLGVNGVAPSKDWPFHNFTVLKRPSPVAFIDAKKELLQGYYAVNQDHVSLKTCLASGYPFVTGIIVFPSLVHSVNGIVPMPGSNEKPLGGHAVCCIGYDDEKMCYEFLNSWGVEWGDQGCFWLPYAFVENEQYTNDFWMVKAK